MTLPRGFIGSFLSLSLSLSLTLFLFRLSTAYLQLVLALLFSNGKFQPRPQGFFLKKWVGPAPPIF